VSSGLSDFEAAAEFIKDHRNYIYRYHPDEQPEPASGKNCASRVLMVDEFFANAQIGTGEKGYLISGVTGIVCKDASGCSCTGTPYECEIDFQCGGDVYQCKPRIVVIYGRKMTDLLA
jgi:hypothetical protein